MIFVVVDGASCNLENSKTEGYSSGDFFTFFSHFSVVIILIFFSCSFTFEFYITVLSISL